MIRTACPIHRDASVEPKLAVHGAPLGGPQQMVMRDADRMQRRFDLAVPEVDEIEQCREVRRQTIVLPHQQLQQRWRIGPMIKDFGGSKAVSTVGRRVWKRGGSKGSSRGKTQQQ